MHRTGKKTRHHALIVDLWIGGKKRQNFPLGLKKNFSNPARKILTYFTID
jgi:hypothetical protein